MKRFDIQSSETGEEINQIEEGPGKVILSKEALWLFLLEEKNDQSNGENWWVGRWLFRKCQGGDEGIVSARW